jgi:magnesium transporter
MLRKYALINGKAVEVSEGSATILKYIAPSREEVADLVASCDIDEHNLFSALDPDELGRLEFEDNGHAVLIFKRPKRRSGDDDSDFGITSVGIFLLQGKMVVVQSEDADLLDERMNHRLQTHHDALLRILYSTINHFMSHLRAIHGMSEAIEDKIARSMENKYLLAMFALEKSLVYYLNAVNSNARLFRKMQLCASKLGFSEEHLEVLDDINIESEQCQKQAEIYSNILGGLMDARASIVNNNMNVLMRTLTVINIVFMPLNLLAGIGGMSEYTMMTQGTVPWPLAYSAFLVAMAIIGVATYLVMIKLGNEKVPSKGRRFLPAALVRATRS